MNALQAMLVRRLRAEGVSVGKLSGQFGVSRTTINLIVNGTLYQGTAGCPESPYWWDLQALNRQQQISRDHLLRELAELDKARRLYREFREAVAHEGRRCIRCGNVKPPEKFEVVDARGYRRRICLDCPY